LATLDKLIVKPLRESNMESRDEMLEAIMVVIETYDDEEIERIFNTLTETIQ